MENLYLILYLADLRPAFAILGFGLIMWGLVIALTSGDFYKGDESMKWVGKTKTFCAIGLFFLVIGSAMPRKNTLLYASGLTYGPEYLERVITVLERSYGGR